MAEIDRYLKEMVEKGASDLHMVVGCPPMFRLKGELVETSHAPLSKERVKEVLWEMLPSERQRSFEESLDLDMAYELEGAGRFRCNFFFHHNGPGAVFRLIPTEILTLEELGLPDVLKSISEYTSGLVLVTGPTGSGKSTTLAAMIDYINKSREAHIITIEDPLEFVHQNRGCIFTQREIGAHANSFADALKVASRENPDIILVGEMRDRETIGLALTCAELGILVFGTLHTNSASKTVDRVINAFPAEEQEQVRTMFSESLRAVIAQQLLKTADGRGRCAANEVLIGSTALASIVRSGKISQINSMIQTGTSQGMQSMDQHLMQLVKEGRITGASAYEKAMDKGLFAAMKNG
ncbi:MAG: type IV pilus twitching motility protein PilT [Desulfobacterales bacterium]|nr:type IV pilus twitching motility protein PilT [Desulfobacterales bacterium]